MKHKNEIKKILKFEILILKFAVIFLTILILTGMLQTASAQNPRIEWTEECLAEFSYNNITNTISAVTLNISNPTSQQLMNLNISLAEGLVFKDVYGNNYTDSIGFLEFPANSSYVICANRSINFIEIYEVLDPAYKYTRETRNFNLKIFLKNNEDMPCDVIVQKKLIEEVTTWNATILPNNETIFSVNFSASFDIPYQMESADINFTCASNQTFSDAYGLSGAILGVKKQRNTYWQTQGVFKNSGEIDLNLIEFKISESNGTNNCTKIPCKKNEYLIIPVNQVIRPNELWESEWIDYNTSEVPIFFGQPTFSVVFDEYKKIDCNGIIKEPKINVFTEKIIPKLPITAPICYFLSFIDIDLPALVGNYATIGVINSAGNMSLNTGVAVTYPSGKIVYMSTDSKGYVKFNAHETGQYNLRTCACYECAYLGFYVKNVTKEINESQLIPSVLLYFNQTSAVFVTDEYGTPIFNATVTVVFPSNKTIIGLTDSEGLFLFVPDEQGNYLINVTKEGVYEGVVYEKGHAKGEILKPEIVSLCGNKICDREGCINCPENCTTCPKDCGECPLVEECLCTVFTLFPIFYIPCQTAWLALIILSVIALILAYIIPFTRHVKILKPDKKKKRNLSASAFILPIICAVLLWKIVNLQFWYACCVALNIAAAEIILFVAWIIYKKLRKMKIKLYL